MIAINGKPVSAVTLGEVTTHTAKLPIYALRGLAKCLNVGASLLNEATKPRISQSDLDRIVAEAVAKALAQAKV